MNSCAVAFRIALIWISGVLVVAGSLSDSPAQDSVQEAGVFVPRQIVQAGCGQCLFDMPGDGCDLAVRIAGVALFVDGSGIDDHGDAHAADGLCNQIRQAIASGTIRGGRFVADEFRLVESAPPAPRSSEAIFEEVWSTARDHFYRADMAGIDWGQAKADLLPAAAAAPDRVNLSGVINQLLDRLQTSHTHYYTPDDVEYYHLADIFSAGPLGMELLPQFPDGVVRYNGIGVFTRKIDGKWFVVGAIHGGPAALAGIQRGTEIVSVDGRPFEPTGSFRGKAGVPVDIVIQATADPNERRSVRLTPAEIRPHAFLLQAMKDSMHIIESGGKKIGYVRIWSYAGSQFHELLVEAVTTGSLSHADALIIDLRDGWGGADPEYLQLFNRQIPRMVSIDRAEGRFVFDSHWRKPAALLVNEGTRSGKELIAYGFLKAKLGPVVGARTAGAVVAGTLIPIAPDGLLYLATRGVEVDGEVLEGRGVEPDVVVPWDLPYADALDPQLQRAIDLLSR
jgi:carboxyl-terminal processing protease